MQEASEAGKYVTDGKHTYPYNMFLDEDINAGKLKFCDKPLPKTLRPADPPLRTPVKMPLAEREALANKLGISLGDLGNMSPQELANAESELAETEKLNAGFTA